MRARCAEKVSGTQSPDRATPTPRTIGGPSQFTKTGPLNMKNNRKGFTLIELLIVVVIIGILAAIAIPKFANTKDKAYLASMKSDLRNLITAEEAYFADSVKYTSDPTQLNYRPSTGVW